MTGDWADLFAQRLEASRPRTLALLLALFSAALLLWRIDQPAQLNFDETHYVAAARALVGFSHNSNPEHPLLAKTLIAASIRLLGDTPMAWRLPGALMGVATVLAVFFLVLSLLGSRRSALLAAVLTLFNQLLFVQARIAMLDVYCGGFLMLALALLAQAAHSAQPRQLRRMLALAGVCLGCSVASKWATAPYVAGVLLLFAGLRVPAARGEASPLRAFVLSRQLAPWRGASLIDAIVLLGAFSVIAYLLTFWPALLFEQGRLSPTGIVEFQGLMLQRQMAPLGPHPDISPWWQWPLPLRPQWYYFAPLGTLRQTVFLVGNPAVMWGGLLAVAACLYQGWRDRHAGLLLAGGAFVFAYGLWIVIPKQIAFYYYYYLPALFLAPALAAVYDRHLRDRGGLRRWVTPVFLVLVLALFAFFYPALSAWPIAADDHWLRWVWLPSWGG